MNMTELWISLVIKNAIYINSGFKSTFYSLSLSFLTHILNTFEQGISLNQISILSWGGLADEAVSVCSTLPELALTASNAQA
jgi:hypothetical protein